MTVRDARLKLGSRVSEIEIGGVDVSAACSAIMVSAAPRSLPEIHLQMRLGEIVAEGKMRVTIDGATEQALKALGWKPPPDDVEVTRFGTAEPEYLPGGPA